MYLDPTTVTIPSPLAAWQRELEERTTAGGHRTYRTPDGAWLPSVTSVLKATEIDSPELAAWRERQTPHDLAEVEALRDEGCARGALVHDLVEGYLVSRQEGRRDWERPQTPWWPCIMPALRKVDRLCATELAVWSGALGVAGRLDCLAFWCGTPVVIDWKTARKRKRREWLLHHHEQIAAYIDALTEQGVTVGGEPVRCGVLVSAVEGSERPTIHELGEHELGQARERFADKLERFYLGAA